MICPVCANRQFSRRSLLPELTVAACSQCGLLVSEIVRRTPAQPQFARIDDEAYHRSVGVVRRRQAREILDAIRPYVGRGAWLDIGCSFGYLLLEAREAGFDVAGLEPDEQAARSARALLGGEIVRHGLMTDAARPDASADIISTLDVLEHVPVDRLSDFARMIHRKLRPGGLWVIKAPSTEGLHFKVAHRLLPFSRTLVAGVLRRLWQSDYEYPHTVYFNVRTLRRFLEQHGYDVLASMYLADIPNATVMDRLLMDDTFPKWQARLIAPAIYAINVIEKMRGKSDALLVIARRVEARWP